MMYSLFCIVIFHFLRTTSQKIASPFLSPEDILHAKQTFKKGAKVSANLDLRPTKFKNVSFWPNDQVMGRPYSKAMKEELGGQEAPSEDEGDEEVATRDEGTEDDYRWPNGIIPYKFIDDFSPEFKMLFAMQSYLYRLHTCVRFVPFDSKQHKSYLGIVRDEEGGCSANVGQTIFGDTKMPEMHMTDTACRSLHDISHEMMHVLGFRHEHQRIDRDDYVRVFDDHISDGMESEFVKGLFIPDKFRYMPYNTKSIMHYPTIAFAKPGTKTIIALNGKHPIRNEITPMDYARINLHYKCGEESKECEDLFPKETCQKLGKGIVKTEGNHVEPVMLVEQAQCLNQTFAKFCKKTCGQCNEYSTRKHKTYKEWKKMKEQKSKVEDSGAQESPMQSGSDEPCLDDEVHCQVWAKNGLCSGGENPELVRKWCPKSCRACDQTLSLKRNDNGLRRKKQYNNISKEILNLAKKVVKNSRSQELNKLNWKSRAERRKDDGFSQFKGDQKMG